MCYIHSSYKFKNSYGLIKGKSDNALIRRRLASKPDVVYLKVCHLSFGLTKLAGNP